MAAIRIDEVLPPRAGNLAPDRPPATQLTPLPAPVVRDASVGLPRLLFQLLFDPLAVWTREHFEEPIVLTKTTFGSRVVMSDPAAIRHVLFDNANNYVKDDLQQRILRRTTGTSLFSAEGDRWRLQRKLLAPLFTPKRIAAYLPGMVAAAGAAVARLGAHAPHETFDLAAEMSVSTLDVLGRTIFPHGLSEDCATVATTVRKFAMGVGAVSLLDLLGLPEAIPGLRRIRALPAIRAVERRAARLAARARTAPPQDRADLVSALSSARDAATGESLSEREIRDNISMFIGAGSETSASGLTWSLFLLSRTPHVRDAVEGEIDDVVGDSDITPDTVARLVLTRAVIEESMRLYPPAPLLGRQALADDRLLGHHIPAGTAVLISPWVVHRHKRLWAEPDAFDPRRFLPENRDAVPRFGYLPFGAGPRTCIGPGFALQEMVVILACLMRAFRFTVPDQPRIRVFQRVTLFPAGGMPASVTSRQRR